MRSGSLEPTLHRLHRWLAGAKPTKTYREAALAARAAPLEGQEIFQRITQPKTGLNLRLRTPQSSGLREILRLVRCYAWLVAHRHVLLPDLSRTPHHLGHTACDVRAPISPSCRRVRGSGPHAVPSAELVFNCPKKLSDDVGFPRCVSRCPAEPTHQKPPSSEPREGHRWALPWGATDLDGLRWFAKNGRFQQHSACASPHLLVLLARPA